MNQNEFRAWLEGFLEQKEFISKDDIERIRVKLQETNTSYPIDMRGVPAVRPIYPLDDAGKVTC